MQLTPTPISTTYELITERPLMQGVSGDVLIYITARSDGRFGYAVLLPSVWIHAGSGASLDEAQASVAGIIKERKKS